MSSHKQLLPIEFTEAAFKSLEGSWFRWTKNDGTVHPRSWYKENVSYGITPRGAADISSGMSNYVLVYKMKKDGTVDFRKMNMTFHKYHIKMKPLILAEQDLL